MRIRPRDIHTYDSKILNVKCYYSKITWKFYITILSSSKDCPLALVYMCARYPHLSFLSLQIERKKKLRYKITRGYKAPLSHLPSLVVSLPQFGRQKLYFLTSPGSVIYHISSYSSNKIKFCLVFMNWPGLTSYPLHWDSNTSFSKSHLLLILDLLETVCNLAQKLAFLTKPTAIILVPHSNWGKEWPLEGQSSKASHDWTLRC